jgi:hypothetical protein
MLLHEPEVICINHFTVQLLSGQLTFQNKVHNPGANGLLIVGILYYCYRDIAGQPLNVLHQFMHLPAPHVVIN